MNLAHPSVNWERQQTGSNGRTQVLAICPICHDERWTNAAQARLMIKRGKWTGRCYEHRNFTPPRGCAIGGCNEPVYGRGWCSVHWRRWYRTGDPLRTRTAGPNSGSFTKGQVPHNKGIPMAPEQYAKFLAARPRGWTHSEESRRKMRAAWVGRPGVPHSEEAKVKIREARARQVITEQHRRAIADGNRGKPKSPEHVAKLSGPAHYRFKGAIGRNLSKKEWREVRELVLARDGRRCRGCGHTESPGGGRKGRLIVHHIIEFRDGGSDTPDNLITWCRACHARHHSTKTVTQHNTCTTKSDPAVPLPT